MQTENQQAEEKNKVQKDPAPKEEDQEIFEEALDNDPEVVPSSP